VHKYCPRSALGDRTPLSRVGSSNGSSRLQFFLGGHPNLGNKTTPSSSELIHALSRVLVPAPREGLKRVTLTRKIDTSHIMSSAAVDGDGATDSRAPDVVQADADEEVQCRYCFEGPEEGEMLSGICACAGGQKHVHLDCLRRWQRMGRSPLKICPTFVDTSTGI